MSCKLFCIVIAFVFLGLYNMTETMIVFGYLYTWYAWNVYDLWRKDFRGKRVPREDPVSPSFKARPVSKTPEQVKLPYPIIIRNAPLNFHFIRQILIFPMQRRSCATKVNSKPEPLDALTKSVHQHMVLTTLTWITSIFLSGTSSGAIHS